MNIELTPLQGRVAFHQERIFRSAGGSGVLAHLDYVVSSMHRLRPGDFANPTRLMRQWHDRTTGATK